MLEQRNYYIEKKMILMTGEYNRFGKLCARVMVGTSAFLVDRSPLQVLDDTLTYIGFDLKGATTGAKVVLDKKAKCPIIVNPYLGICLFPTKSPKKADCIWFNPEHIEKTTAMGNNTIVELSNGYTMIIESKLASFNDKIEKARQLIHLSTKRGKQPDITSYEHTPPIDHQLTKEKSGKYNFDILENQ
ncbi:competence protein ComK [Neobacillus sp. GCM10023253]|uniref:competence protein ComK n=1 Tax=Neobacillus sp. GCM10023253 TaxID=3252644 RepID=UPI00360E4EE0